MAVFQETLTLRPRGSGMHEFTEQVRGVLKRSGFSSGTVTVFCQHTSASLVIMENANPSARRDLEAWLTRLVPADDPHFEHTLEGPDDMPSHITSFPTPQSVTGYQKVMPDSKRLAEPIEDGLRRFDRPPICGRGHMEKRNRAPSVH